MGKIKAVWTADQERIGLSDDYVDNEVWQLQEEILVTGFTAISQQIKQSIKQSIKQNINSQEIPRDEYDLWATHYEQGDN